MLREEVQRLGTPGDQLQRGSHGLKRTPEGDPSSLQDDDNHPNKMARAS